MLDKPDLTGIIETLDGIRGLVYLQFLGRETYVSQFKKEFVSAKIYASEDNVDQRLEELVCKNEEYGNFFLEYKGRGKGPGAPKIYQARLEPIFQTLDESGIKFENEWVSALLMELAFLNNKFPHYFAKAYTLGDRSKISTRNVSWLTTLSIYFTFLSLRLVATQKPKREISLESPLLELVFSIIPKENLPLNDQKRLKIISENDPKAWIKLIEIALSLNTRNLEGKYAATVSSILTLMFDQFIKEGSYEHNPKETKLFYKQGELLINPTFKWSTIISEWLQSILNGHPAINIDLGLLRCDAFQSGGGVCAIHGRYEQCKYNRPGKALECPILRKKAEELITRLKSQT